MSLWTDDACGVAHPELTLAVREKVHGGGEGGIRTHETVARLRHFQCRALGQLCDLSRKLSAISSQSLAYHAPRIYRSAVERSILLITNAIAYIMLNAKSRFPVCGGGGIRTHERLAPLAVFETAALGHYATPPDTEKYNRSRLCDCGRMANGERLMW